MIESTGLIKRILIAVCLFLIYELIPNKPVLYKHDKFRRELALSAIRGGLAGMIMRGTDGIALGIITALVITPMVIRVGETK